MDNNREILYLYYGLKKTKIEKLKQLVEWIWGTFFKTYLFSGKGIGALYFLSYSRKDYEKFMCAVYEECDIEKSWLYVKVINRVNFYNFKNFFKNLFKISKLRTIEIPKYNPYDETQYFTCDIIDVLIIYLGVIRYLGIENSLKSFDFSDATSIVVLCDVWETEHMLVNYANGLGLVTISCQHAIFHPGIYNNTMHFLNFWEVPSKFIFTWGVNSKKMYEKNNRNIDCRICGNPIISKIMKPDEVNLIGIAADIPLYKEYNENMIEIVQKFARIYNFKVVIRLHPTDSEENYKIDEKMCCFGEDLEKAKFIVGHTTTMIITYLASGKKVLKYESDIPYFEVGSDMCFNSLESFKLCYNSLENIDFNKLAENEIQYIAGDSKMRYRDEFNKILNKYYN